MFKRIFAQKNTLLFFCLFSVVVFSQVGIGTVNPNFNTMLDVSAIDKGILIPRVVLNDIFSESPLTAPVEDGTMIFSSGGTEAAGYYFWLNNQWNVVFENPNKRTYRSDEIAPDTSVDVQIPGNASVFYTANGSYANGVVLPDVASANSRNRLNTFINIINYATTTAGLTIRSTNTDMISDLVIRGKTATQTAQTATFMFVRDKWVLINVSI